jgi:hypothetical protein
VTLGIPCLTMRRSLRRLRRYVIIHETLRVEIDPEGTRAFARRRDRLADDAELADYDNGRGRRTWTWGDRCLSSPPDPKVPPVVPSGLRSAPIAVASRFPRTRTAGGRNP